MRKVVVNLRTCLGCKSCELACALSHSGHESLAEALATRPVRRIRLRRHGEAFAPVTCRHCLDAPCVFACISGARQRTDEGIRTNDSRCVACGMCYMVCPSGAIERNPATRSFASCDRCGDGEPRCVDACPTGALRLIEDESAPSIYFEILEASEVSS